MDSLLRDVGDPRRFHTRWPNVDVTRWPGQELYLVWRHPVILLVCLLALANILLGLAGIVIVG